MHSTKIAISVGGLAPQVTVLVFREPRQRVGSGIQGSGFIADATSTTPAGAACQRLNNEVGHGDRRLAGEIETPCNFKDLEA
jgi:hypothetical protein